MITAKLKASFPHIIRVILTLIILAMLSLSIINIIDDPDLWWHLTVGKWILAHKTVPTRDLWNAFSTGQWIAYSWAFEVVVAFAQRQLGNHGLLLSHIALSAVVVTTIVISLASFSGSLEVGLLLGVICIKGLEFSHSLRPQSLSWALLALTLLLAERIRKTDFGPRNTTFLMLTFCIWANTNITPIIGLAIGTLWLAAYGRNRTESLGRGLIFGTICFLGTLLTPYGGREWLTFFSKMDHPFIYNDIREFQPSTINDPDAILLLFLVAVFLTLAHSNPQKLKPLHVGVTAITVLVSLSVNKFVPQALLLVSAQIAVLWGDTTHTELGKLAQGIDIAIEKLRRPITRYGLVFAVLGGIGLYYQLKIVLQRPLGDTFYLEKPLDFVISHKLPLPIAHPLSYGGYMMNRFSDENGIPTQKVVIDGRTNVDNPEIMALQHDAFYGKPNWEDFLSKTQAQTVIWPDSSPLVTILHVSAKWCHVFSQFHDVYNPEMFKSLIPRAQIFTRCNQMNTAYREPPR